MSNTIYGNPIGATTLRPDWNQTDSTKADYIRNKPDVDTIEKSTYYPKHITLEVNKENNIVNVDYYFDGQTQSTLYTLDEEEKVLSKLILYFNKTETDWKLSPEENTESYCSIPVCECRIDNGHITDCVLFDDVYLLDTYLTRISIVETDIDNAEATLNLKPGLIVDTNIHAEIFNDDNNTAIGEYAHAEGSQTHAGGVKSHAEGESTQAGGACSHAEGSRSIAEGDGTHAEGISTRANGLGSHAEGNNTQAYGNSSHAEGEGAIVTGQAAHAEGNGVNASGNDSHAEGYQTQSKGNHSHAEGEQTIAEGSSAHAEGSYTYALGDGTHTEGSGTRATHLASHAEGYQTEASNDSAHAEGNGSKAIGNAAHAEGINTVAVGNYSHAEGQDTNTVGSSSHAEGYKTVTNGDYSHAEGNETVAFGKGSHAEGNKTVAYSVYAHAEGNNTYAWGNGAHAEGNKTFVKGDYSHAEGHCTTVLSNDAHAEGFGNVAYSDTGLNPESTPTDILTKWDTIKFALARGQGAHVEGKNCLAFGTSHAEGVQTIAKASGSHAEGENTVTEAAYAHAEGYATKAVGSGAHSEGKNTQAVGNYSHAEGENTVAYGAYSHTEGYSTNAVDITSESTRDDIITQWKSTQFALAHGQSSHVGGEDCMAFGKNSTAIGYKNISTAYQFICGKYAPYQTTLGNIVSPTDRSGLLFMVGNGVSLTDTSAAFWVNANGTCVAEKSWLTENTADYAEYFEWLDGNVDDEDRRGYFVTFDGNKVRKANADDDYILGITSATPVIVGNAQTITWHDKYLKDIFGSKLTEIIEIPETTDETTGEVIPAHTETHFILNPEYNPDQEYIGRDQRPEWSPVGTHGQLVVIDDGTCEVNGFCKVADGGTATKSDTQTPYRVIERLDDTHIRVFIK